MLKDCPYEIYGNTPFTCFTGICDSKLYLAHTQTEWQALFEILMSRPKLACDLESSGFRWFAGDRICGMSFGFNQHHWYVPVRHKDSETGGVQPPQLDMDVIRPDIQKLFNRKDLFLIGHNFAKFDRHFFKTDNIDINCAIHDTLIQWRLLDQEAPGALKDVCTGWRDLMGFWHPGIVHKDSNKDEKAISTWRAQEAKARKAVFTEALVQQLSIRESEIRFQGWKKNDLKKWVIQNDMVNHKYYRKHSKEDITYDYVPIADMTKYAALDTFLAWRLYEHCLPKIQESPKLVNLYKNEIKLSKVLFKTERKGVYIDKPYLEKVEKDFDKELLEKEKSIQQQLGKITVLLKKETKTKPAEYGEVTVNITSNDQLAQALINNLGITLTDKTDTGKWAMDANVITKLAKDHEICKDILEYRKLCKLQNTYVRNILSSIYQIDDGGWILHPYFNQNVSSGRSSSSSWGGSGINFQNIPAKSDVIRKAFICPPDPDYLYFLLDYSQVEVRLTAHFSQDPILLDGFKNGLDVHLKTTCGMFGLDYEESLKAKKDKNHPNHTEVDHMRKYGKILNFSAIYQVGPTGLADQIPKGDKYKDYSKEEWIEVCESFLNKYFENHKAVKKLIIRSNRFVRQNGYFENTFGRRRYLSHYNATKKLKDDSKFWMEKKAQRQGTNHGVQSEAGDVFKFSCVRVDNILNNTKSSIVNLVHDEIQMYIHKDDIYLLPKIKEEMEKWDYRVPLVVDVSVSTNSWGEKDEIKDINNIDDILKLYAKRKNKD